MSLCPAHDDGQDPALSIRDDRSAGKTLVKCFAGCAAVDVMAALNMGLADLFDEPRESRSSSAKTSTSRQQSTAQRSPAPKTAQSKPAKAPAGDVPIAAEYIYVSAEGETVFRVTRHEPEGGKKTFVAWKPRIAGGWQRRGPADADRVLYRLPAVLAAAASGGRVYLVEGEKDADSGAAADLVCTTSAFGASSKWLPQYTQALAGADVVLVADRDKAGYERAIRVRDELTAAGVAVSVVEAAAGKDLTDHLKAGFDAAALVPIEPEQVLDDFTVETDKIALADSLVSVETKQQSSDDDTAGQGAKVYTLPNGRLGVSSGRRWVEAKGQLFEVRQPKDSEPFLAPFVGCTIQLTGQFTAMTGDERVDAAAASKISRVELVATHPKSGEQLVMHLSGQEWRSGDWLDGLWPDVDFPARKTERQDAVRAVRQVSKDVRRKVEHVATGWRELDGIGSAFVHAGGAITVDGNVPLSTRLPDVLAKYELPDPAVDATELQAAARASIGLMETSWLPRRIAVVMCGAAYRAVLGDPAVVPGMVSAPELGKTNLAVIAAQHFAPTLSRDAVGISMADTTGATPKSASKLLVRARDVLVIADDFAPDRGPKAAAERMGEFVRQGYGRFGRTKLTREGELVEGETPGGLLMVTGEMLPSAESARSRMLRVGLPWSVVPVEKIRAAQHRDQATARSQFMSTLIQWVARQGREKVREWVQDYSAYAAERIRAAGYPARPAEHCSALAAGWAAAAEVMVANGVWSREEAKAYMEEQVWPALFEAAEADRDGDEDKDTAGRIVRLLSEALASGQAHLTDGEGRCPSEFEPAGVGWRDAGSSPIGGPTLVPSGLRVGVVRSGRLLLFPGDVLTAAARRAEDEGQSLNVTVSSASEMLDMTGKLRTSTENGKRVRRPYVRIGGVRARVWDIDADLIFGDDGPEGGEQLPLVDVPSAPGSGPGLHVVPPTPDDDKSPSGEEDSQPSLPVDAVDAVAPDLQASEEVTTEPTPAESATQTNSGGDAPAAADGPRFLADCAVVDVDGAHLPDGSVVALPENVVHVGDLAMFASDVLRLGSGGGRNRPLPGRMWLTPEYARTIGLPGKAKSDNAIRAALRKSRKTEFFTKAWDEGWETKSKEDADWIMLWRGKQSVVLTSLAWSGTRTKDIAGDDISPAALARRMGLYGTVVTRPWNITPAVTGLDLLEGVHGRLEPVDLPDLPWGSIGADFAWRRPGGTSANPLALSEQELAGQFVHVYDKNAAYLAAAGAAILGEGEMHHVESPDADQRTAGVWRVTGHQFPADAVLPSVFAIGGEDSGGWVSSAMLGLLQQFGPVEVAEAWLFDRASSTRAMTGWYERMKSALDTVKSWERTEDHRAVETAVKLTYTAAIGRLASAAEKDSGRPRYRPDWRAAVVSMHTANAMRAMLHAGAAGSWPVVMGRSDAVAFISDSPDPDAAWPGRPSDLHPTQLGKYKWSKSAPLADWLALVDVDQHPRKLLDLVDTAEAVTGDGEED